MKKYVIYNKTKKCIEKELFKEKEVIDTLEKSENPEDYKLLLMYPNYKTHETVKENLCVIIDINTKGQKTCKILNN